jgi:hypothetical protein
MRKHSFRSEGRTQKQFGALRDQGNIIYELLRLSLPPIKESSGPMELAMVNIVECSV